MVPGPRRPGGLLDAHGLNARRSHRWLRASDVCHTFYGGTASQREESPQGPVATSRQLHRPTNQWLGEQRQYTCQGTPCLGGAKEHRDSNQSSMEAVLSMARMTQ